MGGPELIRGLQCLNVIDVRGWGVVVVRESGVEGHPGSRGDRFGWNPRQGVDAAFVSHGLTVTAPRLVAKSAAWRLGAEGSIPGPRPARMPTPWCPPADRVAVADPSGVRIWHPSVVM